MEHKLKLVSSDYNPAVLHTHLLCLIYIFFKTFHLDNRTPPFQGFILLAAWKTLVCQGLNI